MGHALCFSGDILHGGDPIVEGVRYIIACFCYTADCGSYERGGATTVSHRSVRSCQSGDLAQDCEGGDLHGNRYVETRGEETQDRPVFNAVEGTRGADIVGNGSGAVAGGGVSEKKRLEFRGDETFSFGFSFPS